MQPTFRWQSLIVPRSGVAHYFAFLLLAVVWLALSTQVHTLDIVPDSLHCYRMDGTSCAGDVTLGREFSTATLTSNPVITFKGSEPAVLTLKIAGTRVRPGTRGGFLFYRMEGLLRPQALLVAPDKAGDVLRRPWALWQQTSTPDGARSVYGTTPDYIRLELPWWSLWQDGDVVLLHVERAFGTASFALGPELAWRGRLADTIWRNGWIGAQLILPLWLLLLLPPLYPWAVSRLRPSALPRLWPGEPVPTEFPALRLAQTVLVILLASAFIVPLWYWVPLRALQLYLPDPVSVQGALGDLLRPFLAAIPQGAAVGPETVAPLGKALNALATVFTSQAATIATIAVILAIAAFGVLGFPRRRLPSIGAAPMAAAIIAFVNLLFLEAWRMPIGPPAVVFVGLGTILAILVYAVLLTLLDGPLRQTDAGGAVLPFNRRDWAIFAVLSIAYFVFRCGDVTIPGTVYTDETASYGGVYVLLGGFYRWVHTLALPVRIPVVVACVALLVIIVAFLVRIARRRVAWLGLAAVALLAVAFVVATPSVPMTPMDGMMMFRYPPLLELVRAWFDMFNLDYLTAARLAALAAAAFSVGLVYLLARALGSSVLIALIGCAIFAAAHITYFFAVINGDTYFHVAGTLVAAICIVIWLKTGRPRWLIWAGVATLGCYFFRQGAVELVGVVLMTAAAACLFDQRFRNRATGRALVAYLVIVAVPILLYQKILVGSWFFWSNPPFLSTALWHSLAAPERWFAEPWTFTHADTVALAVALFLAAALVLWRGRRLVAIFLLSLLVLDILLQHLFARGTIDWQGYQRYLVPLHISVVALIVMALDMIGRRFTAPLAAVCGIVLLAIVVVQDRYAYEPVQCVRPLEFAPLIQYNGQSFFFVPEKKLKAALPPGVGTDKAAFVFPAAIAGRLGFGIYAQNIGDQQALYQVAKRDGRQYLAFLVPQTAACVARTYYLLEGSRAGYMLSPRTSLDPAKFAFVESREAPPLQIQIFKLK